MAISVVWTPKASINYDPDDPVTTGLFGEIIDNEVFLYEWLGHGFTPAQAHSHNGVDSSLIPQVIGNGYSVSSSGFFGAGGGAAVSISGVAVGSGQRILVWADLGTTATSAPTIQIRHNGAVLSARTPNTATSEASILANDNTVRTGTLELFILPFGSANYTDAQLMYQIIQE